MNTNDESYRPLFLDALDWLTQPHKTPVVLRAEGKDKDDAKHPIRTVHPTHEGLIKQLRTAIASSIGGSAGGKPARERIPLDADALVKYEQIEAAILERFAEYARVVPHLLPEDNLRAWAVIFLTTATEEQITIEYRTLEQWKTVIEEKLSPPNVIELPNEACPECGASWYSTVLNAAVADGKNPKHTDKGHERDPEWYWVDEERRPALTATYRNDDLGGLTKSFAKCGHCGHVWMGSAGIRALAYILENKQREAETA